MRFIYCTDLHGSKKKYNNVLNYANKHEIKLIHLGADLLPKFHPLYETQKKFVGCFLLEFYQSAKDCGVDILACFGNDDLFPLKVDFKKYARLLNEEPVQNGGFEFKAYEFVPDYPFGLKTACKIDYPGWEPEGYISPPVEINDDGSVRYLRDTVDAYFQAKGTIENDLKSITATNKTIMAIHSPPYGIDLDVCNDGRQVGSKAVYNWIEKAQPALVLSGHIHESPSSSGIWKAKIGNTVVIQPGQLVRTTTLVDIDITDSAISSEIQYLDE